MMAAPARICEQCGYVLHGLREPICPECGTPFDPSKPQRIREWKRWLLTAGILFILTYAPYGWLVTMDYQWSEYRWFWIKSWLALPLFLPGFYFRSFTGIEFDEPLPLAIMTALNLLIILGLGRLAMRDWLWFISIAALIVLFSIFNSFGTYHLFRM